MADRTGAFSGAAVYFPGLHARGGAERLAIRFAAALQRSGYSTRILTDEPVDRVQFERDLGDFVDLDGVGIEVLTRVSLPRWVPQEVRNLLTLAGHARQIRRMRLSLFVNAKFKSELPGCGRSNVYYVHFPHRLTVPRRGPLHSAYLDIMSWFRRRVVNRAAREFVETYDLVLANSSFTRRHVSRRWHVESTVVYPPVDLVAPGPKEKIIAVVGRFQRPGGNAPYKAQDELIDAFRRMPDLHEEGWRLVLVGGRTAEDHEYFQMLQGKAAGLPVDFMPDASRTALDALLAKSSLYWHAQGIGTDAEATPERQEHFGISVVEAMSAGAIPLVYGTGGPVEIVSGVDGLSTWTTLDELEQLTRSWSAAGDPRTALIRERMAARVDDFTVARFDASIEALVRQGR